jgi:hypothetical protein
LLQVFVATFWWIIKEALENLWCTLRVFLVFPLLICEVISFYLVLHFASLVYIGDPSKVFCLGAIGSNIAIDFVVVS